jgi:hypothetical protein
MKRETKSAWTNVIESVKAETLAPDDMTVARFAQETGRSVKRAGTILCDMERSGAATKRWVVVNGFRVAAYRLTANR